MPAKRKGEDGEARADRDLETEIDRLYQLPLAGFIDARNDLARRLKREGDDAAASRVKALAKPSISAWTVNRLAVMQPRTLTALLEAGDELRRAQQRGLGAEVHREAMSARRNALAKLRDRAEELLSEAGHAASAGTLGRVVRTLEALSVHGTEGEDRPRAGRLGGDLEPPGVEALTVFGVAKTDTRGKIEPARPKPSPKDSGAPRRPTARQLERAKNDLAEAKEALQSKRGEARRAEQRAERARKNVERTRALVDEAERNLTAARRRLAEAEERTEAAGREQQESAADLRRAQETVAEAAARLERLTGSTG